MFNYEVVKSLHLKRFVLDLVLDKLLEMETLVLKGQFLTTAISFLQ